METKSKRLQMKDVITLAIFNVAILVVMVLLEFMLILYRTEKLQLAGSWISKKNLFTNP